MPEELENAGLLRRLGKRCRALRQEKGISQLDMVRVHGFSLSHYQKIERGVLDPRLTTLVRIASSLGTSLPVLLDGVEAP
jgi:transcriptional regulator with XRE-family HTH domain